ncbi:MAG: acyltransferase [bacterium]|nr:acyltransferase [bacterium]
MPSRRYFPGLNAIRAYAALCVLVGHTVWNPAILFGEPLIAPWLDTFVLNGGTAVTLFFVLSGFLITHLLLEEKRATGTISIRNFQIRRVLRIHPLYYAALFGVFIVMPLLYGERYHWPTTEPLSLILVFGFMANVLSTLVPTQLFLLAPFWTLAVEEQFYLLWSPLMKCIRRPLNLMFGVIVVRWSFTLLLELSLLPITDPALVQNLLTLLYMTRIDCMAVGGIAAYFVFTNRMQLAFHNVVWYGALFIFGVGVMLPIEDTQLNQFLYALAFAALIVNVACNPKRGQLRAFLERPVFLALGNMSYSIYMIHSFIIYIMWQTLRGTDLPTPVYEAVMHISVYIITLTLAYASYRWFETPFLRLKHRFTAEPVQKTARPATVGD